MPDKSESKPNPPPDPSAIALRCAALMKRHEDTQSDMRALMVSAGISKEDAERSNPVEYCRNALAFWAFDKLKP